MRLRYFMTCWIIVLIWSSPVLAVDDVQYWSQYALKVYDHEKFGWIIFADVRTKENVTETGLYYVSQRFQYRYRDYLNMGLNYTYLNSRATAPDSSADDYKFQHRLELEGNPSWNMGQRAKINMRNRMEFRWIEDKGSYNTRFRQRWTLTLPLPNSILIKNVYASAEVFYNLAEHEYKENRVVPLGLGFEINEQASLNVYYMIQSQRISNDWSSNQVFGSLVKLSF